MPNIRILEIRRSLLTLGLALACLAPVAAQSTQPVWWPPLSLYGRPVAQPFFDFPTWARYSYCRPAPLAWGYDPFPNYGPCDPGGNMCPPSVACPGNFVAHRPSTWYGSADFAPLTMDRLDGIPLAGIGASGAILLTTEDLQTEFAPGGKYTIGHRIFDCYRLEGTYLGSHSWEDSRIVTNNTANSGGGAGTLSTIGGLSNANFASASVRSNFQSGEINLRYWGDMPPGPLDVSLLVGVRYMRIADQFQFDAQSALPLATGTTLDYQANTTNDMWGVQLGIQFDCLVTTRWWLDVDLKGGIYNDHVGLTNALTTNGVTGLFTDTLDRTVWMGDISVIGNWQMTPYWTLRLGYQALIFNGLSLAHEQEVSPLFLNITGPVNDRGAAIYHGPVIGLGANW